VRVAAICARMSSCARRDDKMVIPLMAPKTVALSGAACLTIGWLAASLLSPPVARLQTRPTPRTARPAASSNTDDAFTETLRLKLDRNTSAPTVRRNPFVFGSSGRMTAARAAEGPASGSDEPAPPPAVPTVVGPPFKLSGIAATIGPEGEIRTAVLSDGTTVHLVKAGDRIGGYAVGTVGPDSITLTDGSGAEFVIRLR
jgi:hypothetical protein